MKILNAFQLEDYHLNSSEQFISHCVWSTSYKLRYLSFCWLGWWTLAISLSFILLMRVNLESNTNQGHRYSKNKTTHYLFLAGFIML